MGVIYVIENKLTNQMYVGQTANHDPNKRFMNHKSAARGGKLTNQMYADMREIGEENFTFEIIETCLDNQLNERETYWIKELKTIEYGYNKALPSGKKKFIKDLTFKNFIDMA